MIVLIYTHTCTHTHIYIKIIVECLTHFERKWFNSTNFWDLQVPSSGATVMNEQEYK